MYADARIFLLPLLHDERLPAVAASGRFLRAAARGDRSVSTATLTWDEVTFVVRRVLGLEVSAAKGEELLRVPRIAWLSVDLAVVRRAAELYRSLPLRPRDAIHAACALENGETGIVSEDGAYDRVSGLTRTWPPR